MGSFDFAQDDTRNAKDMNNKLIIVHYALYIVHYSANYCSLIVVASRV